MRKNKKLPPEPFDVGEFLRPTDTDLRSALNSLLHGQAIGPEVPLGPGPNLGEEVDVAVLPSRSVSGTAGAPELASALGSDPPLKIDDGLKLTPHGSLRPPKNLADTAQSTVTQDFSTPGPNSSTLLNVAGPHIVRPPVIIGPPPRNRQFAIRPAHLVEDGHSRAERQVYLSLWENAAPHDQVSRLLTIGFASMGKLTGLSESNARINLRSLVQKLAIDEFDTYHCATSQGRTYRIYHAAEILRRRHVAGLRWVMRRTLAVVFVDPETKLPLFNKTGAKSEPGLNLSAALILINAVRGHLQQYGPADNQKVELFLAACRDAQPALDPHRLAEAIHQQALLTRGMSPAQSIEFLVATVPAQLT